MGLFVTVSCVWIYMLTFSGCYCRNLTLTPETMMVAENTPVELACTYNGTRPLVQFAWYKVFGEVGGPDMVRKAYVNPPDCFRNVMNTIYRCIWTIKFVDRSNDGDRWVCSVAEQSNWIYSNVVSIGVSVPIKSVSLTLPNSDATLNVAVNTEQKFTCRTDGGLPVADITWYKDNGTPGDTSDDLKIQNNISVNRTLEKRLYIRTSTLSLYPTRSDQDNRIYCTANNSQNKMLLMSIRKPLLNVLYAPESPTEFRPIRSLIKYTEVTIQWKPGSNSGTNQTFVLLYKKSSDIQWKTIYVAETGYVIMNYTLTDLEPNTAYVGKMYAQNSGGNSSFTEEFNFHTLEHEESTAGNVGLIVGVLVGVIVVVVLVSIAVIFGLRRRGTNCGYGCYNHEQNNSDQTATINSAADTGNQKIGSDPTYETLNDHKRDVATYSSLQSDTSTSDRTDNTPDRHTQDIPPYLTLQSDTSTSDRTDNTPDRHTQDIPPYLTLQSDTSTSDRTDNTPDRHTQDIPPYLTLQSDTSTSDRTDNTPDRHTQDIPPYLTLQSDTSTSDRTDNTPDRHTQDIPPYLTLQSDTSTSDRTDNTPDRHTQDIPPYLTLQSDTSTSDRTDNTPDRHTQDIPPYLTLQSDTSTSDRTDNTPDRHTQDIPPYLTLQSDTSTSDRTDNTPDRHTQDIPPYLTLQSDTSTSDRTDNTPDRHTQDIPPYLTLQSDTSTSDRTDNTPDRHTQDIPPYLTLQPDVDHRTDSVYEGYDDASSGEKRAYENLKLEVLDQT